MNPEDVERLRKRSVYPDTVRQILKKLTTAGVGSLATIEVVSSDNSYVVVLTFKEGLKDPELVRSMGGFFHGENGALIHIPNAPTENRSDSYLAARKTRS